MSEAVLPRVRLTIDGQPVEIEPGATIAAALAVCGGSAYGTRASITGEPRAPMCGMGVCQDTFLALAWAHIRTLRLADGPDEVHRESIAKWELAKWKPSSGS